MGIIQKQTLQGTAFSYAGIVLGFITVGVLYPRVLTKDQNGLLGLLITGSVLLSYLANLGLNSAGGRYFPYFRDYNRQHNGYLLVSLLTSLTGFLLSVGVLLALRPWVVAEYSQKSSLLVQYYYLLIPLVLFTLFFNVFDNYARLLYDPVTGTFLQQFAQRLFILLNVVAYGLGWYGFELFLYAWLGAYALQLLLMLAKVLYDRALALSPHYVRVDAAMRRQLLRYASLSLLTGLSSQIILHIDKVLVNNYLGLAATGVYTISSYFGTVIAAPAQALYKVSGVIIADAWKANDVDNIRNIYRKSCLSQLIIGCLVFVGVAANLPGVFGLLLPGYEAGYYVVLWIGLGKLFDMATGVNGLILSTSRYYAWDSLFFLLLVVGTVLITQYLLPRYGLEGAAIGAALATGLFNVARTAFVWLKVGLQPFSWRNGAVLAVAGAVWALSAGVPYQTGAAGRIALDLALRSVAITVLYVGALVAFRIDPDLNRLLGNGLARLRRYTA